MCTSMLTYFASAALTNVNATLSSPRSQKVGVVIGVKTLN